MRAIELFPEVPGTTSANLSTLWTAVVPYHLPFTPCWRAIQMACVVCDQEFEHDRSNEEQFLTEVVDHFVKEPDLLE